MDCYILGNKCSSTPCLNGGTCKQTFDDRGYSCTCPVDVNGFTYTGDNCELQSQSSQYIIST